MARGRPPKDRKTTTEQSGESTPPNPQEQFVIPDEETVYRCLVCADFRTFYRERMDEHFYNHHVDNYVVKRYVVPVESPSESTSQFNTEIQSPELATATEIQS